ncbi:hypothetical protein [Mycolicibacterium poriferae]|mgnify:CR=1 FL=1|jgi:hypothetical protein|uniref:hypothetical protein n=1 Tax=Mycolicibacterium poriferae TaxID=39694 RepID=UPI0024B9DF61|nr:hypothetical protein [Mycolicibacterium poriferae]
MTQDHTREPLPTAQKLAQRAVEELTKGAPADVVTATALVGLLVVAVEGREVDVAEAPVKFAYEPRVVDDANGHLDDFLARDVRMVHFEATDESAWYATIELAGGAVWQLHFGADEPSRPGQSRAERVS